MSVPTTKKGKFEVLIRTAKESGARLATLLESDAGYGLFASQRETMRRLATARMECRVAARALKVAVKYAKTLPDQDAPEPPAE